LGGRFTARTAGRMGTSSGTAMRSSRNHARAGDPEKVPDAERPNTQEQSGNGP